MPSLFLPLVGSLAAKRPESTGLELRLNGKVYLGWTRARVSRGIESLCGEFQLEAVDRWEIAQQPWAILEEDACEVWMARERIVSGFVDKRSAEMSGASHSLSFSGRDKAASLVDCSAILTAWEFDNQSVPKFCADLCAPFGITVSLQEGIPESALVKATKLSIDPGDSAFDALEKACRWCALLPISDGNGGVTLCRAGSTVCTTSLVEGQNIKSIHVEHDATEQFRTYKVLAQHSAKDTFSGAATAHVQGTATDSTVKRSERVKIIRPEHEATPAQAVSRAQWEATTRAARAHTVTVEVKGWTQADGSVWPINALVDVDAPTVGVKGQMLITQADYSLDNSSGASTALSLKMREAYLPKPEIIKKSFPWVELKKGGR